MKLQLEILSQGKCHYCQGQWSQFGVNFRILTELFYQNMFECSLLQHMYRPKWTVLQKRHTFHKLLVNWYLQGDTWFSWIGNNYLI